MEVNDQNRLRPALNWLRSLLGQQRVEANLNLDLELPRDFDCSPKKVRSQSQDAVTYVVEVSTLSCTCANFINARSRFKSPDVRRLCKHLIQVLQSRGAFEKCDLLLLTVLGTPPKDRYKPVRLISGRVIFLGTSRGDIWVDVFSQIRRKGEKGDRATGPYRRFGFNRATRQWSFGEGPPGAREIKGLWEM